MAQARQAKISWGAPSRKSAMHSTQETKHSRHDPMQSAKSTWSLRASRQPMHFRAQLAQASMQAWNWCPSMGTRLFKGEDQGRDQAKTWAFVAYFMPTPVRSYPNAVRVGIVAMEGHRDLG